MRLGETKEPWIKFINKFTTSISYEGKAFLHGGPFPGGFRKPKMERAGQDVSEHFVKCKCVLRKIIILPVVRLHSQQQVT